MSDSQCVHLYLRTKQYEFMNPYFKEKQAIPLLAKIPLINFTEFKAFYQCALLNHLLLYQTGEFRNQVLSPFNTIVIFNIFIFEVYFASNIDT